MIKLWRKLRLILCILGWHNKKLFVGGYRCLWCGKYCGGYVPEQWKVVRKKPEEENNGK